jgi:hypothetical protein
VIVPVPSIVLVDVVDELVVTAGFVVVVVDEVCAKAVVSAIALTAPAANNVINLFFFIFVLCFVKRMLSVVHLFDCSKLEFIQPHSLFVIGERRGRLVR